ncbi:MAG: GrpB family protein [Ruthenibacterium sp.]
MLFACGSYCEGTGNFQTHFIHVVRTNSTGWLNYINFRDYLNRTPSAAKEHEALKLSLARRPAAANAREKHLAGKHDFIARTLKKARAAV